MKYFRAIAMCSTVPAIFFLGLPQVAHHYLDPGTGSFVLQAVIGVFAAAAVAIGLFWKQIKAFVGGILFKSRKSQEPGDEPRE